MSAHIMDMNLYLTYLLLLLASAAIVTVLRRSSTTIRSSREPAHHAWAGQ